MRRGTRAAGGATRRSVGAGSPSGAGGSERRRSSWSRCWCRPGCRRPARSAGSATSTGHAPTPSPPSPPPSPTTRPSPPSPSSPAATAPTPPTCWARTRCWRAPAASTPTSSPRAPRLITLTGGLDVVPDLTFEELRQLLTGRGDTLDAVLVPAMEQPEPAELAAINAWLRQQSAAGALTVSVCNGARALARSGLLDGRPATSHWLRMRGLRADFPAVKWQSGLRYVDDGDVITAAGVLSAIDGALRIVERLADMDTARQAADAVHWRHYSPGAPARMPVQGLDLADLVAPLNSSYQTRPSAIGVQLVEGAGELELASVFNGYTEQSVVGHTIAVGDGPIRSEHGLTFVPRRTLAAASGDLDRLLVPGHEAARAQAAGTGRPEYVHPADEFAFDAVIRDIARTYDVPTARFAAKTLEYPVMDVELRGGAWPWRETLVFALLILLGVALALGTGAVARRLRT
ncbi:DJ-1/PfpI family protein [Nonomuraea salmonea]|uniref:DJ-1/PfpI family protein n=1 Tax=Nonomuraea salmonea TaxID=46181 RepID=UPI0031ECD612